jgi:hypothetical protein
VEDYLNRWLADSVRDTVRNTTFERYEQITCKHIVPEIGRVKLKALTPAHVRGLYRKKLEAGLSARTVQYVHVKLHKAAQAGRSRRACAAQRVRGRQAPAGAPGRDTPLDA